MTSMEHQSLLEAVRAVSRRSRRVVLGQAIGWTVAVVAAVGLLAGLLDWSVRSNELAFRLLLSLAVAAAALAALWRWLAPAWRWRPGFVETADRIERRHPRLKGRLSSATEFLLQDEADPLAGSAELRRAVVAEVADEVRRHDLASVVQTQPARRALAVAAAVSLMILSLALMAPEATALAAQRLAMPWRPLAWPLRHELVFVGVPDKVAAGSDVEFVVVDRKGSLPPRVELQWKLSEEDRPRIQVEEMRPLGEQMIVQRSRVQRSFHYRAVGGDHSDMPWQWMEVAEPPHVATVALRAIPPAYSGLPETSSTGHLRALVGTQVTLQGRSAKRLQSAQLVVEPSVSAREESEAAQTFDLRLGDDRRTFQLADNAQPWLVRSSGSYWIRLVDEEGIEGGAERRWEIRAVADHAPAVHLEQPGMEEFVTPQGVVELVGRAVDDLQLQRIELRFLRTGRSDEGEMVAPLFEGPETPAPIEAGLGAAPHAIAISHSWRLDPLPGLRPGEQLLWHIAATDYLGQTGQSSPRRLLVITTEELQSRFAQRQAETLARLAEALTAQREARSQTSAVEIQLEQAGRLQKRDIDQLKVARSRQDAVEQMLLDDETGVAGQLDELLSAVRRNQLEGSEADRRLSELRAAVEEIASQRLPNAQMGLIAAAKAAEETLDREDEAAADERNASVAAPLAAAGREQDAIVASLERLLGDFSQWDNYRRFAREVTALRRSQDSLHDQTQELAQRTRGRDVRRLGAQDAADLQKLAQRQADLARRLEKLQGEMSEFSEGLADDDPVAAQTLADAVDAAQRDAISAKMRQSMRQLEQNQVSQAAELQRQVDAALREVLDTLANRREHELSRRMEKLDEAAQELADARRDLERLRKEFDEAQAAANEQEKRRQLERLSKEQEQLGEEAGRLGRRLDRLMADQAAESASRAAQQLAEAGERGEQGEQSQLQREEAQRRLEEAERQARQAAAELRQQLLQEQLAQLHQWINGLAHRQETILEETIRLEGLKQSRGELTRGQLSSLADLAGDQRQLHQEAGEMAARLQEAAAFAFALESAQRDMLRVAALLDRRATDEPTQQLERSIIHQLRLLLEALKPPESPMQEDQGRPGEPQQPSDPQSGQVANLAAQLKLLQLMQEDLQIRTAELEQSRRDGELSADGAEALQELARRQGKLAETLLDLAEKATGQEESPRDLLELEDPEAMQKQLERTLDDALQDLP